MMLSITYSPTCVPGAKISARRATRAGKFGRTSESEVTVVAGACRSFSESPLATSIF
jgi:hypothetical protein